MKFTKDEFNAIVKEVLNNTDMKTKKEMLDVMMDNCCEHMNEGEMKNAMNQRMGKGRGMSMNPMMEMMTNMMGGGMKGNSEMRDMCRQMMMNMKAKSKPKGYYNADELTDLFEDWCSHVEDEILEYVKDLGKLDEQRIAEKFGLSDKSVSHLVKKLKDSGKL